MRLIFVVLVFVGVVFAGEVPEINTSDNYEKNYILYETSNGTLAVEDLTQGTIEVFASESDITYHYYSRRTVLSSYSFKANQIDTLRTRTDYDPNRRTLFIIHGWTNSYLSQVNRDIRTSALDADNINVIVVDWSPIARRTYLTAQGSVRQIGEFVGSFIQQLNSRFQQSFESITVAGFSLGAHIAGNAGAACRGRIGTLIGLDPAGPGFSRLVTSNRLDPTDGAYVQVIHTNDGGLGFGIVMGHADYYPNGGSSQPGCGIDAAGTCAHNRVFEYYAESLNGRNNFLSRNCGSYLAFSTNLCRTRGTSIMGRLAPDTSVRGEYFLDTNRRSPFATGSA